MSFTRAPGETMSEVTTKTPMPSFWLNPMPFTTSTSAKTRFAARVTAPEISPVSVLKFASPEVSDKGLRFGSAKSELDTGAVGTREWQ
jgi:hypothetical protein